ncbi:LLM class F420-dependent oxidoreductase [Rhizocola hellebori]|uniref:LLM class F420-dependent oxidoreductase n=1 Tax=Rhizocola hellebori TaxID=1392758 RepID=A0A8J3Q567_9ACTN|nr:LLM class flavin-dependent oxidoreductase [Rhizocola hellebori]GIH03425.1 LLM class F420-dependent oxidoreductase [Rhizocola hellebori]
MADPLRSIRFDVIADGANSLDTLRTLAIRAERHGFTALHVGHHAGQPDPLRALVAVAEATTRLRVGTRMLNPALLSAAQLARDIAAVHRVTGGRFELGVGLGWDRADFAGAGRPFEPLAKRAETLEAVLCSLASGQRVPVVVGGQSDAALSVAARHADGVELTGMRIVAGRHHPHRMRSDEVAERIQYLMRVVPQRFEDIELGVRAHLVMVGVPARNAARIIAAATGSSIESIMDSPFALVGMAAEIAEKIHACRADLGITRYSVSVGAMDELVPVIQECH